MGSSLELAVYIYCGLVVVFLGYKCNHFGLILFTWKKKYLMSCVYEGRVKMANALLGSGFLCFRTKFDAILANLLNNSLSLSLNYYSILHYGSPKSVKGTAVCICPCHKSVKPYKARTPLRLGWLLEAYATGDTSEVWGLIDSASITFGAALLNSQLSEVTSRI